MAPNLQAQRAIEQAARAVALTLVRYRGRIVAAAAPERAYLAPDIASLADGNPLLRLAAAMCLYARDVATGELPGHYDDGDAELYARCVLIPDNAFRRRQRQPDVVLAERFRVPQEQIAAKRADLAQEDT